MNDTARKGQYSAQRIGEKQVHELIGISRGLLADGHLNDSEIEFVHRWLVANDGARANPLVSMLLQRLEAALHDGIITEEERADLDSTLRALTANDFELGEVLKATSLPLCNPAPAVDHSGARICFTGTFTFGKRSECEKVASSLGGIPGSLTQKTRYLVIGEYATDSWKHSSFGNKIIQAAEWRDQGHPLHIISEQHWRLHL